MPFTMFNRPNFENRELWLNLAIISAAWGGSFLFVKLISQTLPPFAFAAGRGFVAMMALLLWLVWCEWPLTGGNWKDRLPTRREMGHMVFLGTTNGWLTNVTTAIAVRYVDSAVCAMLQATVPLMVAVLAHFLLVNERLQLRQGLGVFAGLLGVACIIGPLTTLGQPGAILGVCAMLVTSASYACGTIYGRRVLPRDPVILALGQQAFGAVMAALISALVEPRSSWNQPPEVWGLLIIVGVCCSALPTALYLRLLVRTGSVPAALIAYLQPVWAMLLGWVILGEHISARALFGTSLVFAGIFISTRVLPRRAAA